jgi:glucose-6-phosphate isomerase
MSNNPTQKPAWQELQAHANALKSSDISDYFTKNPKRFETMSLRFEGILYDYSKQNVTTNVINDLCDLAEQCKLDEKRKQLFSGGNINSTESRAALHTALRAPKNNDSLPTPEKQKKEIQLTLARIKEFSTTVREGRYLGVTSKPVTRVVAIGIGGSDLGARLICAALKHDDIFPVSFVSNIDPDDIHEVLEDCDAETTLFITISKSFKTQETLANTKVAMAWLKRELPKDADITQHFAAITANEAEVIKTGLKKENIFPIWDWVNGRFSLWSAVGLPIAIYLGFDHFEKLLQGAHAADQYFFETPLDRNIPALMGLIGIWNRNFLDYSCYANLPYCQRLQHLPKYLQQLEMESNGKNIDHDGRKITDYETSPVVFGEAGTIGQHSFYQLLHQGTETIPADFIGILEHNGQNNENHISLLHNMLAQSQTLMAGKENTETDKPYKYFEGNKPNSTFLINKLDAYHLGILLAFYEHKTFIQGVIWNINSFDQFGVELGKTMAEKLNQGDLGDVDPSTRELYSFIHKKAK